MLDNYTIHFYLSFVLSIVHVLQTKYVAELLKVQEQGMRLISSVFFSTLIFCTQSTVQSEANQDFFFTILLFLARQFIMDSKCLDTCVEK